MTDITQLLFRSGSKSPKVEPLCWHARNHYAKEVVAKLLQFEVLSALGRGV